MSSVLGNEEYFNAVYRVNKELTFHNFVAEQKYSIAGTLGKCMSPEEALEQIEWAMEFMAYYMDLDDDGLIDYPENTNRLIVDTRKSAFEILLDLHSAMRATCAGFQLYVLRYDPLKDDFMRALLEYEGFEDGTEPLMLTDNKIAFDIAYCTMVIYETSDLDSAVDVLAKTSWSCAYVPWTIRSVLVQETILDEFLQKLDEKLQPFEGSVPFERDLREACHQAKEMALPMIQKEGDTNELKPTLVRGATVEFFLQADSMYPSPVVVLNTFRTLKEVHNAVNSCNGGSVTLWTEQLNTALETAYGLEVPTVWVNTYGAFNPEFPYAFRPRDYCYGSEYAIREKKIKTIFVPSEARPTNAFMPNRRAIAMLGLVTSKVQRQGFSFVKNVREVHYEMVSAPAQLEDYNETHPMSIVDDFWKRYTAINTIDKDALLDTVHNTRKTIVIPYGVSYSN